MKFISTRGHNLNNEGLEVGFCDAILSGLAKDGGLYVPKTWPKISIDELKAMQGLSYNEIALKIITPFIGDEISQADLKRMIDEAYASFNHKAIAPLVQLDENNWVLELFHGPTLAFKDVAMQLMSSPWALARRSRPCQTSASVIAFLALHSLAALYQLVVVITPASGHCLQWQGMTLPSELLI